MKYNGGCHCGKVRFEVDLTIETGLACNCSICQKKGTLLAFTPSKNFRLISGEDNLTDYQFNKKVIHHKFCKTCGVTAFSTGMQGEQEFMAINIRCLDDIDLDKIDIKHYDGKSA